MNPDTSDNESPRPGWFLLALLLLALLPIRLYTALDTDTFWVDEVYTVLVAERSLDFLVSITTVDAHPPLFYLIVKLFLLVGGWIGFVPETLLVRLPSVMAFFGMVAVCWVMGRRLLGTTGGTLFALAVAVNGPIATHASDARNYTLLMLLVTTCFLLLGHARRLEREGAWSPGRIAMTWGIYTFCAGVALWLHLLASIALFFVGIVWICLALECRKWKSPFVIGGLVANAVAAASFLPWLFRLHHQLGYLSEANTEWMTPPEFFNWMYVFIYWYPYGRFGTNLLGEFPLLWILSILVLLPIVAWIATWAIKGRSTPEENASLNPLIFFALLLPPLFVTTLWMLSWFGVASVFHGLRYPVIMLPIWLFSMVGLSVLAAERFGGGRLMTVLLVAPFLLYGLLGQWTNHYLKTHFGRGAQVAFYQQHGLLPPAGSVIHVSPSSLLPHIAPTFGDFRLVPLENLAGLDAGEGTIHILTINWWHPIQEARPRLVRSFIRSGLLAENQTSLQFPHVEPDLSEFTLYTLHDLDWTIVERIFHPPTKVHEMDLLRAAATALPEHQYIVDGFHELELLDDGEPFCWAVGGETRARFDSTVAAGEYLLKVMIMRQPYPEKTVDVELGFVGEPDVHTVTLGEGFHHLQIPVVLRNSHSQPSLQIVHPVWRPVDYLEGTRDNRPLTFLFLGAVLVESGH
ncbi:MAG: hypothetical protein JJU11_12090 [Candidatus Sumerlaeia bacterium]|nr:hypothetical protein [Candidatus Sumerlaeia bacterium]